jgi:hypothetical protein
MNPMGMQWMMDAMQGKPRPTNTSPGMIYMLCGATQRSNTNPADRTSPAIPIGPHWMITWPFNAAANGLPTTVRDKGAWVMFAGPHMSICMFGGDPWDGNEYHEGDKAVWKHVLRSPITGIGNAGGMSEDHFESSLQTFKDNGADVLGQREILLCR